MEKRGGATSRSQEEELVTYVERDKRQEEELVTWSGKNGAAAA